MSNREQYKRAFQALHASRDFSMEAMDMNTKKMHRFFCRMFHMREIYMDQILSRLFVFSFKTQKGFYGFLLIVFQFQ